MCETCLEPFHRTPTRQRYCSAKCRDHIEQAKVPRIELSACRICNRGFAFLFQHGQVELFCSDKCRYVRQRWKSNAQLQARLNQPCRQCGNPVGRTDRLFCSDLCSQSFAKTHKAKRLRECTICRKKTTRAQCSDECRQKANVILCQSCGEPCRRTGSQSRFCNTCAQSRRTRADNIRGRARRSKTQTIRKVVTPKEIWLRDNRTCQICKKQIAERHKFPHPQSLSIDHIVPLAKGGHDVPENLQATHLGCNMSKGTQGGAQRRLFG